MTFAVGVWELHLHVHAEEQARESDVDRGGLPHGHFLGVLRPGQTALHPRLRLHFQPRHALHQPGQ